MFSKTTLRISICCVSAIVVIAAAKWAHDRKADIFKINSEYRGLQAAIRKGNDSEALNFTTSDYGMHMSGSFKDWGPFSGFADPEFSCERQPTILFQGGWGRAILYPWVTTDGKTHLYNVGWWLIQDDFGNWRFTGEIEVTGH